MKVVLLMANNTSSPYFSRFAKLYDKSQGIELSFVCLFPSLPDMVKEMNDLDIPCYWIKFDDKKRKTSIISSFFNLYKLFKQLKPDVVHTHLFDDSLPGLFAARVAGVKKRIISKLDAGFHYTNQHFLLRLDQFNNKNATDIITVSDENRSFVIEKEKAPKNKVHLIHQGVFIDEVISNSKEKKDELIDKYNLQNKRVIISVSRYIEWKGYKYIINAAETVLNKYSDVVFLFIGYGDQQSELEKIVNEKNIEERVVFTGWVNRFELNNLYQVASVFVHAATNEPFGFAIAEAMLNKIPIVSTKTGCASDGIEHLKGGYITDFENSNQIADGISYMLENETFKMINTSYRVAKELFSVEMMWKKHIDLYKL